MSRFVEKFDNGIEVAWGLDDARGYFIQVFDTLAEDEDYVLEDMDTVFDSIGPQEVIRIAEYYEVDPVHVANTLL